MRTKKALLESIASLVFLFVVWQFLGCSAQQIDSKNLKSETSSINTAPVSPTPEITPKNFPSEYFEKEWKSKYDATVAELERSRNLWQESKVVNYDFVAAKYAGGNTNEWNRLPVLIKIREGEKISIEKVEKDKDYVIYSRTDGFEDFDTIDKLFNYMRQELEKGRMLEVKYDKKLGYPKHVIVEFEIHVHGTHAIEISKFEVIK